MRCVFLKEPTKKEWYSNLEMDLQRSKIEIVNYKIQKNIVKLLDKK
jgi:hypothetical protein